MTRFFFASEPGVEYAYTRRDYTPAYNIAQHDFGCVDKKGRSIGSQTSFHEFTTVEIEKDPDSGQCCKIESLGLWYVVEFQATRNGQHYGPCSNRAVVRTAAERDVALAKYLKSAAKRALKIGAK